MEGNAGANAFYELVCFLICESLQGGYAFFVLLLSNEKQYWLKNYFIYR